MKILLICEYDGTNYVGWQRQKNGISLQQVLEEALLKITGEKIAVTASGRTDCGVHAEAQPVHFVTNSTIPPEKFALAINTLLPSDFKVTKSFAVPDSFNARRSAKRKTYIYSVYVSEQPKPLKDRYFARITNKPDLEKMNKAAQLFVGEKDFKAFSKSGSSVKTTVRKIYSINITSQNNELQLAFCGNGFLYNMVRIIAGVIIAAGQDKLELKDIADAFLSPERKNLARTMPPQGLCLKNVEYELDYFLDKDK